MPNMRSRITVTVSRALRYKEEAEESSVILYDFLETGR